MIPLINVVVDEVIVPLINGFARAVTTKQFWFGVLLITIILMLCWLISGQAFGEYFSWYNVKRVFGLRDLMDSLQDKLFGGTAADPSGAETTLEQTPAAQ